MILLFFSFFGACINAHGMAPLVKLNDGYSIPGLGFGTWLGVYVPGPYDKNRTDEVEAAVAWALDAGYRHLDTAPIYYTEEQVGRAVKEKIKQGLLKREDVFIATKLWNSNHRKEQVVPALRESLAKLQLDYVDLYLIHAPIGHQENGLLSDTDYLETWQGMEEARRLGLARSVGVCNFNQQQLERLIAHSSVKPATLQVELNLNNQQPGLVEYCREQDIAVVGFTPFGSLFYNKAASDAPPPRVDDPQLTDIAQKYNKTVPQVALRYLIDLGVIPIPKTVTKARVEENIDVFDFQLTREEKDLLRSFDRNYRTFTAKWWVSSPYYPFEQ